MCVFLAPPGLQQELEEHTEKAGVKEGRCVGAGRSQWYDSDLGAVECRCPERGLPEVPMQYLGGESDEPQEEVDVFPREGWPDGRGVLVKHLYCKL